MILATVVATIFSALPSVATQLAWRALARDQSTPLSIPFLSG
jgi:hypothetical protein